MPPREYYEKHRAEVLAKHKLYREENKDKLKEYRIKYNTEHKKERIKYNTEHKKEITEKRRVWAKEKYTCVCGSVFRRDRKSEHDKISPKHKEYCESIEPVDKV